jgi:hypothetical protein
MKFELVINLKTTAALSHFLPSLPSSDNLSLSPPASGVRAY